MLHRYMQGSRKHLASGGGGESKKGQTHINRVLLVSEGTSLDCLQKSRGGGGAGRGVRPLCPHRSSYVPLQLKLYDRNILNVTKPYPSFAHALLGWFGTYCKRHVLGPKRIET